MRRKDFRYPNIFLGLALILVFFWGLSESPQAWGQGRSQTNIPRLFDHQSVIPAGLPANFPASKRKGLVRLNPSWVARAESSPSSIGPQTEFNLNLFEDFKVIVVIDESQFREKRRFVLIGHVKGVEGSQVIMAFYHGALSGLVLIPGKGSYQIVSTAKGFHWTVELDTKTHFECEVVTRAKK